MQFLGQVSESNVLWPLIVLSILATLIILDYNMLRILVFCNCQMERKFKSNICQVVCQYYGHLICMATKLSDGTNFIHGDDWLNKYKAHVDYESKI